MIRCGTQADTAAPLVLRPSMPRDAPRRGEGEDADADAGRRTRVFNDLHRQRALLHPRGGRDVGGRRVLSFRRVHLWRGGGGAGGGVCSFCDTDFVGVGPDGGKFASPTRSRAQCIAMACDAGDTRGSWSARAVSRAAPTSRSSTRCTARASRWRRTTTRPAPAGIDWICVSPKARAPLVITEGNDSSSGTRRTEQSRALRAPPLRALLSPRWTGPTRENTRRAVAYCLAHRDGA